MESQVSILFDSTNNYLGVLSSDTTRLLKSKAWYSNEYQGVIKADSLVAYGNTDTGLVTVQDMIGQKQYEITDHLGNVLSTVSDQHLGRDVNGDSVIDYYNAVIPAAYDYYPFGMLMPFRYTQDNSTHCATITTDKLYPVWVHHNIILNNGTTPIANSYGSGVATVLTGGTGINIYSPMITSGATISVPLQQKLAYNMDLNIQSISGSYSAQVLDSDNTVLGAITIAESGNYSLSYSAPSASPVTLVFKAQSAGSDISVLAAGYWVFTHQSQMVTMTICDQNDNYRFGFNGQMKDNEWAGLGNHLDYKFRGYDSRTCKFSSIDPLTKKFPWYSSYQFAGNTPIQASEMEGAEARIVTIYPLADGSVTKTTIPMSDFTTAEWNSQKQAFFLGLVVSQILQVMNGQVGTRIIH